MFSYFRDGLEVYRNSKSSKISLKKTAPEFFRDGFTKHKPPIFPKRGSSLIQLLLPAFNQFNGLHIVVGNNLYKVESAGQISKAELMRFLTDHIFCEDFSAIHAVHLNLHTAEIHVTLLFQCKVSIGRVREKSEGGAFSNQGQFLFAGTE